MSAWLLALALESAVVSAADGALASDVPDTDWGSVGLVLALVGAFLIGCAVLARGHKPLVEALFGDRRPRPAGLREAIFQRALLVVGFTWLAAGFALELFGRLRPAQATSFPVAWSAGIALATGALLGLAWVWASREARRSVREHLRAQPRDLRQEMALAKELGELYGVESRAEDTVGTYLERLHAAIGIEAPQRRVRPTPVLFELDEVD